MNCDVGEETDGLDHQNYVFVRLQFVQVARCAGSDDSMSASGSAGPGFNPRRGSKF